MKRGRDDVVSDQIATNVRLSDDPSENRQLQEEIDQLHGTFRLVNLHSGGEENSVGWMTELLLMMDETGAVWDDGEVSYEKPDRRFRSLKDTMSFRTDEFKEWTSSQRMS